MILAHTVDQRDHRVSTTKRYTHASCGLAQPAARSTSLPGKHVRSSNVLGSELVEAEGSAPAASVLS